LTEPRPSRASDAPPAAAAAERAAPARDAFTRDVRSLPGVGPALAQRLSRLQIATLADLLLHLPERYEDRTRLTRIGELRDGETVTIEGRISGVHVTGPRVRRGRGRAGGLLVVGVDDASGHATLAFYHHSSGQRAAFERGGCVRACGEVRRAPHGMSIAHPEYVLRASEPLLPPLPRSLTPHYGLTNGVTQARLRQLVAAALVAVGGGDDAIDACIAGELPLPSLRSALATVHAPPPDADTGAILAGTHPARQRLALEELLAQQCLLLARRRVDERTPSLALPADPPALQVLLQALPFTLTAAQRRVLAEVDRDLVRSVPMRRLLQGDVGSGKTVIAAYACLRAVRAGHQAALMAPTELLAAQHHANLARWLGDAGIDVELFAGGRGGRRRRERLARGEVPVAVGTHALFADRMTFRDLAVVVVDEQHRFGVRQRAALLQKALSGTAPHQLVMTATPIPRTLAQTAYADLDTSVIDELPPGRLPVRTLTVPDTRRDEVIERVAAACARGRQAYWVCTAIDESPELEAEAAAATAAQMQQRLPWLRAGLVHGRLAAADKAAALDAFRSGAIALLVATTVIEVGVDVPNATLMVIENAERLGLSQLHQLRGRVGRGAAASHCVLLYHAPLSATARARLGVLRATNDGFAIAEKDLELRGPGEVLGTRQTGEFRLRCASLVRDAQLLLHARALAGPLVDASAVLVQALLARWLPAGGAYADV
jgi:ATP-dependent DNA helicase RecG